MRRFALLCWLTLSVHHATAQRVDLDFSGAMLGSARVDGNTVYFAPVQDEGPPRWYFRIQATQPGQALTLVTTTSDAFPLQAYFSTDAGVTWLQTPRAIPDEKQSLTRYEATPTGSSLLFSSHLPFSHATAAQWMESLRRADGIEVLPFASSEAGLNVLRFCEGDRVEARRPLIWIQSGKRADDGAGCWTAMAFGRWLAGSSTEAVWLRQNAEVLILPLMCSPPKPFASKQIWGSVDKTLRQITNEERLVIQIELNQGSIMANDLVLKKTSPAPPDSPASLFTKLQNSVEILTVWTARKGSSKEISTIPRHRIEIPWNTPEATPANYEKLGAALGEALAATLRPTN